MGLRGQRRCELATESRIQGGGMRLSRISAQREAVVSHWIRDPKRVLRGGQASRQRTYLWASASRRDRAGCDPLTLQRPISGGASADGIGTSEPLLSVLERHLNGPSRLRLTRLAHRVWEECLHQGDIVVDATLGQGKDFCQIANIVAPPRPWEVPAGDATLVYGIDVQQEAIELAQVHIRKHLEDTQYARLDLIHDDHKNIKCVLHARGVREGSVGMVCFNLGYLPVHHDICGAVTTRAETTLAAVRSSLPFLRAGGIVSLMCYVGHEGGMEEFVSVKELCEGLAADKPKEWATVVHDPSKHPSVHAAGQVPPHCPKLVLLHKL